MRLRLSLRITHGISWATGAVFFRIQGVEIGAASNATIFTMQWTDKKQASCLSYFMRAP